VAGERDAVRLPPDYAAAVARILRRNLRYPNIAREQGIMGVAMVHFSIARDGTVLAPRLLRGSGSVMLDQEALALLRRVSPLPPLPPAMPGAQASVVVPIGFDLR
jgi:protein TonB